MLNGDNSLTTLGSGLFFRQNQPLTYPLLLLRPLQDYLNQLRALNFFKAHLRTSVPLSPIPSFSMLPFHHTGLDFGVEPIYNAVTMDTLKIYAAHSGLHPENPRRKASWEGILRQHYSDSREVAAREREAAAKEREAASRASHKHLETTVKAILAAMVFIFIEIAKVTPLESPLILQNYLFRRSLIFLFNLCEYAFAYAVFGSAALKTPSDFLRNSLLTLIAMPFVDKLLATDSTAPGFPGVVFRFCFPPPMKVSVVRSIARWFLREDAKLDRVFWLRIAFWAVLCLYLGTEFSVIAWVKTFLQFESLLAADGAEHGK
ncbi:hypothetical protein CKM354_000899600 [Cercospora kikuchii]|uniref:Uncharacterized protein n=1 Tax=Cercospora kikuchii TaxID=84275 RepID=A0A9P3CNS4_9PEZI|nr:uncharacterized protein CKM354_000899600 [Cercospora kikuchii]GIZ45846.1 hypothetical protein CKM354_000899600 [Cercospora kikuchii]